jgi:hypothetical protein
MTSKGTPRQTPAMLADPFGEYGAALASTRMTLLGGEFEFQSESSRLLRLARWAYAHLPAQRFAGAARYRVRLAMAPRVATRRGDPPRLATLSGAGLLCGTSPASSFVTVSASQRSALVVVTPDMLRHAYHVRYEMIEFAVFTLASRAQGLVPLHAACIGRDGGGLVLIGDSGAGKSTTALQCLLEGCELLAEDSVFLHPQTLRLTGVANFLHVRADALRFLPARLARAIARSPVIRRRSGVVKFELDTRRSGLGLAARPLALRAIVFLDARPARRNALLASLPRGELRRRLEATQPYAAQQAAWPTLLARIGRLPAFTLHRAEHPSEAARALLQLLDR